MGSLRTSPPSRGSRNRKHLCWDARKRIQWQRGVLQPFAELGSVVGWLAVIGCGDDDYAALLRQRTDVIVERPYRAQEPAVGRILSNGMGQALGCAQVGAIQDQQRHLVRFCGGGRRRGGLGSDSLEVRPVAQRSPCVRLGA